MSQMQKRIIWFAALERLWNHRLSDWKVIQDKQVPSAVHAMCESSLPRLSQVGAQPMCEHPW